MKNKQLIKAAEKAQKDGYEFMHAIVKHEKGKPLYNVVSIEVILQFGKWIPAEIQILDPLKVTVKGQEVSIPQHGVKVWPSLPEKSISKAEALRRYT